MASKPRLGGREGRLLLPDWVTVSRTGEAFGQFSGDDCDPFERRADGLFLAESFARLDLTKPRPLRAWILANGALDYREFAEPEQAYQGYRDFDFDDTAEEFEREQREVLHILFSIGVLTHTLPAPAGSGAAWKSEWHPAGPWSDDLALTPGLPLAWKEPTRDNHIRLTAFLMNDYVERALAPSVVLGQIGELPLSPLSTRRWSSILAPIYLQLYEGLRRVSEGKPGARRCRECRNVFLVLDGRRERFCSDRERARFNQRAYRARHAQAA
jgi:hypothetical protein